MNVVPENTIVLPNTSKIRIISFDIGIKNLGYCIFDISDGVPSILDWRTVNLMESGETPVEIMYCNTINPPKSKAKSKAVQPGKVCGKKAKYMKGDCYFCETHAKSSKWILPKKSFESSSLKKLKSEELLNFSNTILQTPNNTTKKTKKEMTDELLVFFKDNCLEIPRPIGTIPITNSKQLGMITLGINMKRILDTMPFLDGLTHVIMENQIPTIASRMNNVQGILTMYFIMKYENTQTPKIEYISSINKLKNFVKTPDTTINNETDPQKKVTPLGDREKYKQHKTDGIEYTNQILDKHQHLTVWKHVLDNKKKDDFADCFLQGIWYIDKHFDVKLM
jgi:hypothetical protein